MIMTMITINVEIEDGDNNNVEDEHKKWRLKIPACKQV